MTTVRIEGAGANAASFRVTEKVISSGTTISGASGITTSDAITTSGAQGALLFLDVTAADASAGSSPTLDITVQGLDPASGNYFNLPGAAFTQVTTSTTTEVMVIHPSVPNDSGTGFRRRPGPLPLTFRLSYSAQSMSSAAAGSSYAFTVGAVLIP